jgi:hypothetical protein
MAAGDLTPAEPAVPRWDLLEAEPPTKERLSVRSALSGRNGDVLIGVDAALRRYVLVRIPVGEGDALTERVSRGIGLQTVKMVPQDTGVAESFVEIACLDPQGHRALDLVIGELVDAVERAGGVTRVTLVQGVLAKWRRFWSGVPSGALSVEQQVGLFGELYFLSRWLCEALIPSRAVSAWRGPVGARNDFELSRLGVEVKATKRADSVHIIHGLDQLLEPVGGTLLLFGLCVRDEASATESLPGLVREMRERLTGDLEALGAFETALYTVGYDDRLEAEYSKLMLRIRTEALYRVSQDFPRLVPASIVGGVPAGVSAVAYELRLDAAAPWMVASSGKAATKLLRDFSETG